jgi:hypothetical protein
MLQARLIHLRFVHPYLVYWTQGKGRSDDGLFTVAVGLKFVLTPFRPRYVATLHFALSSGDKGVATPKRSSALPSHTSKFSTN